MTDYRPTSGKAEIHITLRCNLRCRHCNRSSYLSDPHTPDMTLADVKEFLRQARDLKWYPAILLIGGEPTLHPDFDEICKICTEFAREGHSKRLGYPEKGLQGLVQLWSNQTTKESKEACERVNHKYHISVVGQTIKVKGTIPVQLGQPEKDRYEFDIQDIMVSPMDLGYGIRPHCWQHSAEICGISVDSQGYSPCSTGGAVAGVLGLDFRTKRLADLFDLEKVAEQTKKMCAHCGNCLSRTGIPGKVSAEDWKKQVDSLPKWNGMPVSETWEKAYQNMEA